MTSKISSFNIMLEDLRRRIWMPALSCLGSFLAFPVFFLLRNREFIERLKRNTPDILEYYYTRFFRYESTITQGIILFLGAMIVGIFGFRYLYSRRMTDLYHSLPVKRSRLFFLTWLTGLLIWLIPMLFFMGVTLLLMLIYLAQYDMLGSFGMILLSALRMIPVYLICFLIVYHFCLVCAMISGNAFNALVSSLILGTAAAAVYGIIGLLSSNCFDTFRSLALSVDQVAWASPLVSAVIMLAEAAAVTRSPFHSSEAYIIIAHPAFFCTGCILLLILCLAAAYLLYQKRPSELAEHGIDNRFMQGFLRLVAAFAASQLGGLLFMAITGEEAVGWYLFGVLLFGILFYCIMNIILHMNFKSFLEHKLQLVGVLVFSGVFLMIFTMDLTGYDTRLPAKDSIEKAELLIGSYYDSSYRFVVNEDGSLSYNTDMIDWNYPDTESLYPLLEALASSDPDKNICSIDVDLTLKGGRSFRRNYQLNEEDIDLLRPILESREYLAACYPASCGLFPAPNILGIYSSLNNIEATTKNEEQIQKIIEAYRSDFLGHSSMDELGNSISVGYLNFTYPDGDLQDVYQSLRLDILSDYTQTISLLAKYYPEVILDQEALSITSLNIDAGAALNDPEAEESTDAFYPEVSYTEEELSVWIDDPDQIDMLLPYLTLGESNGNAFYAIRRYEYVGTAALSNGNIVSCYVEKSELPLKAPDSMK